MNAIYAGKHWRKRSADVKYWHTMATKYIDNCAKKHRKFDKPVSITYYWNDRMDLDNHAYMAKLITDSLVGILLEDDTRRYVKSITHSWHDENCIAIVIEEYIA